MKKKTVKPYHLVMYVENSTPFIKKFVSLKKTQEFVDKFEKKYPDEAAMESGYWIDFVITGVTGKLAMYTDGIEIT